MKTDNKLFRGLTLNLLLVLYFCCSNLSSFLGISIVLGMFFAKGMFDTDALTKNSFDFETIQNKYTSFITSPLGKRTLSQYLEIWILIVFYILTKITWYLPSWFLLFVITETYVFWDLLEQNHVFAKIE